MAGPTPRPRRANQARRTRQAAADQGVADQAQQQPDHGEGIIARPSLLSGVSHALYSAFVTRLPQDLRTLHGSLIALRRQPGDAAAAAEARRTLHGLKSRSSMVQILPLVKVVDQAEELLETISPETDLARAETVLDAIIQAEGIFYETQRLLSEESFDRQYTALSNLSIALCDRMRAVLAQWGDTGEEGSRAPSGRDHHERGAAERAAAVRESPSQVDAHVAASNSQAGLEREGPRDLPGDAHAGPAPLALEAPLARLASMEALTSAHLRALARASELAAQERRNVERLDGMVVRLLLEREELRRRNRLLRARLATQRAGGWDEMETEALDSIDQTMVQLQEIVADGRELSADLRATLERAHATTLRIAGDAASARADLLALRMVTLQEQYERLDQIILATASRLGRKVRFVMAADVPLDRDVAAALELPLQHMVRNSVYHGIEPAAERRRAGKDPIGTIRIRAQESPSGIQVEISDDGRGVDTERVAAVAAGKGLVSPAQIAAMGPDERMRLVFISGLSTADRASDLAGRGVGMDAVLSAVRAISGDLDIRSEPGHGTTVLLRVPRSPAHALVVIVEQHGHEFAIPFDQVLDSHEVETSSLIRGEGGWIVPVDGRRLPIHDAGLLDMKPLTMTGASITLLEIRTSRGPVCIPVSSVIDVAWTPLSPAPRLLQGIDTVLGFLPIIDDQARPLVDAGWIIEDARHHATAPAAPAAQASPTVLVVDDSASVRRHLRTLFSGAGYAVREATGGVEALRDVAAHGLPDVITLDVEMAGMDGMETLNALRQTYGSSVPIFVISSRAQQRLRDAASALGAVRYFNKPFNSDELLGAAALAIEAARRSGAA